MALIYVDSAASGAANGTSWADAYTTLAAALATETDADTVWLSPSHLEATGAAVTLTAPTTMGCRIMCAADNTTTPPVAVGTGAIVSVGTASAAMSIRGFAYFYGITFRGGTNVSVANTINVGDGVVAAGQVFSNCTFELPSTAAVALQFGPAAQAGTDDVFVKLRNCTVKFGATTQSLKMLHAAVEIQGLTVDSSGSTPATLFAGTAATPSNILVEASDLSGEAFTNLVNVGTACYSRWNFRNCKLPSSISVVTGTNPGIGGPRVFMHSCDSADTHIRFAEHSWQGSVVSQTGTLIRTGGATQADGTAFSFLMNGSANSVHLWAPLQSPEFAVYNTAVGSALTATVEILRDNVTALKDNEIWLEVQYLGTSGFPQGSIINDRMTTVMSTPANQASSSVTWDTTGMTNANKQKLEVTFTPREAGYIIARVMLAANTSVYVDPYITLA